MVEAIYFNNFIIDYDTAPLHYGSSVPVQSNPDNWERRSATDKFPHLFWNRILFLTVPTLTLNSILTARWRHKSRACDGAVFVTSAPLDEYFFL